MISDACPITHTDLVNLSRAFAARALAPRAPEPAFYSDHQNELLQDLGQRSLLLERLMMMSVAERAELAIMNEIGSAYDGSL